MHRLLLFGAFFLPLLGATQNQQNNWFLGTYLGMRFSGGNMSVVPVKTSAMYAPYGSATWSDPVTGNLRFYTSGAYVYNRNHQQMPNGLYLNNETLSPHTVIVPYPGDPDRFYIFSTATGDAAIYHSTVDLRLQGGLGDVTEKGTALEPNVNSAFVVVKQYYDNGYWLITHQRGNDEFHATRINPDGIESTPIRSNAGGVVAATGSFLSGKMVSTADGKTIAFSYIDITGIAKTELFAFDKECGKLTLISGASAHPLQGVEILAYPAFSPNGKVLYVNWTYNTGQSILCQYNLSDPDFNSTYFNINVSPNFSGDLQLAPDGKIYQSTSLQSYVSTLLNVIQRPDVVGAGCNFNPSIVDLGPPIVPPLGTYWTEHFPEYIADQSPNDSDHVKPLLTFENECEGIPTTFRVTPPFDSAATDVVYFDFGDTTNQTSARWYAAHLYKRSGAFPVVVRYSRCNLNYFLRDTVNIGKVPEFSLGPDTTVCPGVALSLVGPHTAQEYRWSTGDSTYLIQATQPGIYSLSARNGGCWYTDSIELKYHPPLWIALGDEYFICEEEKELVKLDAGEGFTNYKWTPTGDTTQWIIVGDLGSYFVLVKDFRGCSGTDGTIVRRRCPATLFYPNAFTPNGDGMNDWYGPEGSDIVVFRISIWNRWGELVFTSTDLNHKWDGKVNGIAAPADVYYYLSEYKGYFNKRLRVFEHTGNLSLIR